MDNVVTSVLGRLGILPEMPLRETIRAHMHLFAVLPRLGDLARLDDEARGIVAGMKVAIGFNVVAGPRVVLRFADGSVTATKEGGANACLLFPSCAKLNAMFDGEKVTPIPVKGLHRLGDLKKLTRLTDILTRYLKPSEADLADPAFRSKHVELSLLVGLAATAPIAALEPKGQRIAHHMPSGTMLYDIGDGPKAHVVIGEHGKIEAFAGTLDDPTTTIEIRDVDLAVALVKGEVDTFAANGSGAIRASGSLALADEFNTLFDRVGLYLA